VKHFGGKQMRKILSLLTVFLMVSLMTSSIVIGDHADDDLLTDNLNITEIEINDQEITFGHDAERVAVEEGEILEIEVRLASLEDLEDIRVTAELSGYEYSDYNNLYASTHLFDMEDDTTKTVRLEIQLPTFMDRDEYFLRIDVEDRHSLAVSEIVRLHVEPTRHGLQIADVVFSPSSDIQAGRSLLTTVLVQNFGNTDERDVKVTVNVAGQSAVDYIDVLEVEGAERDAQYVSYETTEELFLRIPECTAPGVYQVEVIVEYDEYEQVRESYALNVLESDYCLSQSNERLVIAVGPESQTVAPGQRAVYAVALSNEGSSTETYTFELVAGDWAQTSLSESLVVLGSGSSAVVYANVDVASNAAAGTHMANLVVRNQGEVLQSIGLTTNVAGDAVGGAGSSSISLRNGLELALIILVVLLVVLGLIIGFVRLRRDEEDEQTYY
jgi:uncharacterized membrane protein